MNVKNILDYNKLYTNGFVYDCRNAGAGFHIPALKTDFFPLGNHTLFTAEFTVILMDLLLLCLLVSSCCYFVLTLNLYFRNLYYTPSYVFAIKVVEIS